MTDDPTTLDEAQNLIEAIKENLLKSEKDTNNLKKLVKIAESTTKEGKNLLRHIEGIKKALLKSAQST